VIVKAGAAVGGLAITVRWEDPVTVKGRVVNIPATGRPEEFGVSFASIQEETNLLNLVGASAPIHPDVRWN
jgi:hypothetical protein